MARVLTRAEAERRQFERFADWLKRNPAPDLQELVQRYGGFSRVPVEAWAQFDRAKQQWEARRRLLFL